MVGVFKRSLSFPNKNPNRSSKPAASYHVRSISLPSRSHPLISHLKDELSELKTLISKPHSRRTSAWICDGLCRLKDVHDSLDDILQLPQTQESLRHPHQRHWIEKLLEDFLRFVDVYGIFQTLVLALKEEHWAAQVAIRKRDESKIALYIKAQNNMAKEIGKLMSTIRCIGKTAGPGPSSGSISDAELAGVIGDVIEMTMSVSIALFNGIALSFESRKCSWMGLRLSKKVEAEEGIQEFQEVGVGSLWGLRKKGDEEARVTLKRMQNLEGCIGGIESGSERVFRSLICTRVSLLNILTQ